MSLPSLVLDQTWQTWITCYIETMFPIMVNVSVARHRRPSCRLSSAFCVCVYVSDLFLWPLSCRKWSARLSPHLQSVFLPHICCLFRSPPSPCSWFHIPLMQSLSFSPGWALLPRFIASYLIQSISSLSPRHMHCVTRGCFIGCASSCPLFLFFPICLSLSLSLSLHPSPPLSLSLSLFWEHILSVLSLEQCSHLCQCQLIAFPLAVECHSHS